MMKWQPIETAPEGKKLLVYRLDCGVTLAASKNGCWWNAWNLDPMQMPPTHWHPLPEPPK